MSYLDDDAAIWVAMMMPLPQKGGGLIGAGVGIVFFLIVCVVFCWCYQGGIRDCSERCALREGRIIDHECYCVNANGALGLPDPGRPQRFP